MPHRTAVEEASRRRGRAISPELIEEILGSLGVGAIKSISGIKNIGLSTRARPVEGFDPALSSRRPRANINESTKLGPSGAERNIGGRRPPDTELEALALQKQQAQTVAKTQKKAKKRFFKRETTRAASEPARQREILDIRKRLFKLLERRPASPPRDLEGLSKFLGRDMKDIERLLAKLRELEK